MKVFLISIPPEKECVNYKQCRDVLADYFQKHGIETFVLENNDFGCHPSWLKLKCFDYVDDDFVLCWDLDLLPRKGCPSILNDLNFTKINLVRDTTLILGQKPHPEAPYFRYNCGLVGFPRSYRGTLERVFQRAGTSFLPSYEQYPLNEELSKNGFQDVHELNPKWNCIWHLPKPGSLLLSAGVVHYTGLGSDDRRRLIGVHHRLYFPEKSNATSIVR